MIYDLNDGIIYLYIQALKEEELRVHREQWGAI